MIHIYLKLKIYHLTCCICLSYLIISLRLIVFSFIHLPTFNYWITFHCITAPYFHYPFICWLASRLCPLLAIVSRATLNMEKQIVSVKRYIESSEYMSQSGITALCCWSSFSFLRNLPTDFLSCCTSFHVCKQWINVPISLHHCHLIYIFFFDFFHFILILLTGIWWHLKEVLIWISLRRKILNTFKSISPLLMFYLYYFYDHFSWAICFLDALILFYKKFFIFLDNNPLSYE